MSDGTKHFMTEDFKDAEPGGEGMSFHEENFNKNPESKMS